MSILKWMFEFLISIIRLPFQDSFRSLLKHNIGQAVEIKISGEWKKGVIIKVGSDYAVFLVSNKELFIPLSSLQGMKLSEI